MLILNIFLEFPLYQLTQKDLFQEHLVIKMILEDPPTQNDPFIDQFREISNLRILG